MTLPRLIKLTPYGDHLLIAPHPNVLNQLKDIELDSSALLRGNLVPLPRGTAYINLQISYSYFYNGIFLKINHPDYLQLGVRVTYAGLELVKVKQ